MLDDLYLETILEEYAHPKNKKRLEQFDVTVSESNSSCGDQIEVFLKFDPADVIEDVSWQGVGCAISMATASVLSEYLKGKTRAEVALLTKEDLEAMLGLHQIAVGREKCLLLALTAFRKAVEHP
ncbi:iron-sulfur cluster assembly scaffold protein [Patescibacteria group bacterium]|nr:iron-sulfur cluster assembly scaffold protein [Patescibacteria group bacterium]